MQAGRVRSVPHICGARSAWKPVQDPGRKTAGQTDAEAMNARIHRLCVFRQSSPSAPAVDRKTPVRYNAGERSLAFSGEEWKMNLITTKDRILESALTLFAEKGYDGVGVDAIAEKTGLKGPSLYKHFKGKEEILDALIGKVAHYYEINFGSEAHPGTIPASAAELADSTLKRIQFTLHDETIRKTRRILTMEQFRSQRIAMLATKYNLEGLLGMYRKIFQSMMDAGTLRREDPTLLALQFVSPVTLLIQMCDREPQREQEALELIQAHLNHFVRVYFW